MWQTYFFGLLHSELEFRLVSLEFIGILLTFAWEFTSSAVLSFGEFLCIFGTESCPVVFKLNQTSFKYFNKFYPKKLPLQFNPLVSGVH